MDKDEIILGLEIFGLPIVIIIIGIIYYKNTIITGLCTIFSAAWIVWKTIQYGPDIQ